VSNGRMTVNNELKRMWKEIIMAYSKALSQHLSGGNVKTHKKTSDRIAGLQAQISAWDLSNMKQEC
jgi:hypothetical protein